MEELLLMRRFEMEEIMTSGPSTESTSDTIVAVATLVAVVAVVGGSYYAVRRGLDRRIVRKIKEHLNKEQ
jgi:hypothetical protein